MLGLPITINQDVEFDYVYINDFIEILHEFIKRPAIYSNYNVTTGQPITLLELAEIVREVIGSKQTIVVEKPGKGNHYTGSNERLRSFLGPNYTFTPIRQAIEELVEWYEKHLKTLDLVDFGKNY